MLISAVVSDAQARERDHTLKIRFVHTGEKGEFTFKRNGRYDRSELSKLNKILRDWRRNESTRMDPKLFDLMWEVYQKTGSKEYINVVSGYRSSATNNMLRKRGRGVAKRSRHTQGMAMDFFIPGVPVSKIRKIALRMQEGGVGYYPSSRSPFVHLDTGSIRHWPRMSRRQLASVFPNGETVHVPSDGKPMPGYKRALAKLDKPGKTTTVAYLDPNTRSIRVKDDNRKKATLGKWLKKVLTGGPDEEEDNSLAGSGAKPAAPPDPEIAVARALPVSSAELSPAPLPRALPSRTRMILIAASERSRIAAADELAMLALVTAPPTRAAVPEPVDAQEHTGARFDIASLVNDDNAITALDRSALASLYLAAARRAAALAPGTSTTGPIVTAALPALRPEEPTIATTPTFAVAAAISAPSLASYSLASAGPGRMPSAMPIRTVSISRVGVLPVAQPRAAPATSAADAPGSANEAARALGLVGTLDPMPISPANNVELAYASAAVATAPDGVAAKRHPRQKLATAATARPASDENADSAPADRAVTVAARLTTAAPDTNDLRRLMSQSTTRTRAFAVLERPQPDRVPGFYVAPETAAEAILPTTLRPPRTDRFAIIDNRMRLRFRPARLAGL